MEKRKFLFVSLSALIGDIAWQIYKEGHEVRYYIDNEKERDIADGFVPKTNDWEKDVKWADIVVFDDTLGQGAKAKALRDAGKPVIGGSEYTDRLEDDRSFGQEELKKAGVNIIPYEDFESFDPAIEFVKKNPDRYVIKPSGEAQNVKRRLFVGEEEDGDDVVRMLEAYKRAFADEIKVFQLQRRIHGVEVAVGGFFNGKHFITPININFEHKKLFPGEVGPPTGEMGTSMFWSEPNAIFLSHAAQDGAEARAGRLRRLHRPQLHCEQQRHLSARVHFALRLSDDFHSAGRHPHADQRILLGTRQRPGSQSGARAADFRSVFASSSRHSRSTTNRRSNRSRKTTRLFSRRGTPEQIHIEDVKQVNGQWLIAGTSGVILTVVGTGQTMKQAQAQVYTRIKNILIPNMYYRTDIGDRWAEDSDRLHNWGYLR